MNSRHFVSSGAFRTRDLSEIVEACNAEGITNLELSSGVSHTPHLSAAIARAHRAGLRLRVHNYFPPPAIPFVLNLAALDAPVRQQSIQHCRDAIDLSVELDAPFYSVHAGFLMRLKPEQLGDAESQSRLDGSLLTAYEDAYAEFVIAVRALCEYADERGMDFLVENNVASPAAAKRLDNAGVLLARPDELERFFNDVAHARAGLLVDVGHAKVSATALGFDAFEFLEAAAPYVRAFHLSENSGLADENAKFAGNAWFAQIVRNFPGVEKVIEVYRLDADERRSQIAVLDTIAAATPP